MEQAGPHRVLVTGARGRPPTHTYKVSATAQAGFKVSGQLTIVGIDAAAKAKRTGEAMLERSRRLLRESGVCGLPRHEHRAARHRDCLRPACAAAPTREVVLRLAVTHADRRALEMFAASSPHRHVVVAGHDRLGRPSLGVAGVAAVRVAHCRKSR